MWNWGVELCRLADHEEHNPEYANGSGALDSESISFGDTGVLSSGTDMTMAQTQLTQYALFQGMFWIKKPLRVFSENCSY
ncbi:hypothetical protein SERLA73DRAFT_79192 [Serpula lacrymans var. lacrymans S7.3]|uniref:Uncharacterized protein n=2 Tax=Serpula lacrymans var. lacrymans TaxID=341189 RepID=F8QFK5_SERL3|nr:uncharacterized protein SERLADRAFT_443163 [Serpula lacrymans var. lacrymans S7.9]EGN92989.1 hypothetical protein SERLA73DRAFT_79192 [Serpula lacrymans var. lacrymans S7.3]EGO19701.1 hypothetical protein SERLADRAFT_443163 [Serpula lacrymans var. lacrymans S7.9]